VYEQKATPSIPLLFDEEINRARVKARQLQQRASAVFFERSFVMCHYSSNPTKVLLSLTNTKAKGLGGPSTIYKSPSDVFSFPLYVIKHLSFTPPFFTCTHSFVLKVHKDRNQPGQRLYVCKCARGVP
jgi:hypothetical protein